MQIKEAFSTKGQNLFPNVDMRTNFTFQISHGTKLNLTLNLKNSAIIKLKTLRMNYPIFY